MHDNDGGFRPVFHTPGIAEFDVTLVDPHLTFGLWCAPCGLPSRWAGMFVISPKTNPMMVVWRGRFERCTECNEFDGHQTIPRLRE